MYEFYDNRTIMFFITGIEARYELILQNWSIIRIREALISGELPVSECEKFATGLIGFLSPGYYFSHDDVLSALAVGLIIYPPARGIVEWISKLGCHEIIYGPRIAQRALSSIEDI